MVNDKSFERGSFLFSPGKLKREKLFGGSKFQTKDVLTLQRVKVPKYTPGSTVSL